MIAKFAIVLAAVAAVHSAPQYNPQYITQTSPASYRPGYYNEQVYPDVPPKYEFSYEVNEPQTGDYHSHQEARDGDLTQGAYSLIEADGTRRIVEYTVNGPSGFQAVVRKEGSPTNTGYRPNYVQPSYVKPAYVQPTYKPIYAQPSYVQPVFVPAPVTPVYATTAKPY